MGTAAAADQLKGAVIVTVDTSLSKAVPALGPGKWASWLGCPWLPCRTFCGPEYMWSNNEVTGLCLCNAAFAAVLMASGVFISTALLQLAQRAAGCTDFELFCGQDGTTAYSEECGIGRFCTLPACNVTRACADCEPCARRVHGITASSVITLKATIGSLLTAFLAPMLGAAGASSLSRITTPPVP